MSCRVCHNLIIAVVTACASLDLGAAGSATVTNAVVFTNPSATVLWKTVFSDRMVLPIEWPANAASARLDVTGAGFASQSFDVVRTVDSCSVMLARPVDEGSETILDFTLSFLNADGDLLADDTQTATLGFVRGTGCPASIRCVPGGETARAWSRVRQSRVVLPVPEGMTELTVDNMVFANLDAPGWAMSVPLELGLHRIEGVVGDTSLGCEFQACGSGLCIVIY